MWCGWNIKIRIMPGNKKKEKEKKARHKLAVFASSVVEELALRQHHITCRRCVWGAAGP